jgi:hypothetical protein
MYHAQRDSFVTMHKMIMTKGGLDAAYAVSGPFVIYGEMRKGKVLQNG